MEYRETTGYYLQHKTFKINQDKFGNQAYFSYI